MFAVLLFLLLLNFTQMVKPELSTNSSSSNSTSSSIQTRNFVTFQTIQNGNYLLKSVIFGSNITTADIKFVNFTFDFDVKWLDEINEEWELSLDQNCNFTLSSCAQCVKMVKVNGDNINYKFNMIVGVKECEIPFGGYSMNAKSLNQTSNSQLIAEFDYVPFKFIEDDDTSSSTIPHSTASPSRIQSTTVTSSSLGLGEIIAIAAGCLLVFIIVIGIVIFICCRKRRKAKAKNQKPKQPGSENPHQQVPPNEIGARANIVLEKKQQHQQSEFEEKTCQEPQTMDGGGGEKVIHPTAAATAAATAHPKKSPLVKTSDEHLKALFPDPIEYLAAKAGSVSERQIISGPLDDAEIVISSKLPSKEVMTSSKKQPFLPSNVKNKK